MGKLVGAGRLSRIVVVEWVGRYTASYLGEVGVVDFLQEPRLPHLQDTAVGYGVRIRRQGAVGYGESERVPGIDLSYYFNLA